MSSVFSPGAVAVGVVLAIAAAAGTLYLLARMLRADSRARTTAPRAPATATADAPTTRAATATTTAATILILALVAGTATVATVTLARVQSAAAALLPGVDRPTGGRVTVALVGVDTGVGHEGEPVHVDAISVLSVGFDGSPTALFTIPRGVEQVPLPVDSPLRQRWTSGMFDCGAACQIGALGTRDSDAAAYAELVPPGSTASLEALRDGIRGAIGMDVDAIVEVDAAALAAAVDVLGGVTVTVAERLPMSGDIAGGAVPAWIEPGTQLLDGERAAWFVRSRMTTSDADRMRRQTELVQALREQVPLERMLFATPRLAEALAPALRTDLSPGLLLEVLQALPGEIPVVPLVPEEQRTHPDWVAVHAQVQAALGATVAR